MLQGRCVCVCGPVKETGAHEITDVAIVDTVSARAVSFHSDLTNLVWSVHTWKNGASEVLNWL